MNRICFEWYCKEVYKMEIMDVEKILGCIDNVCYYFMKDNYNFNCDIDRWIVDSVGYMFCILFDL